MAIPPLSWFFLAGALASLGTSALVFFARTGRLQNRLLALTLLFSGVTGASAALLHSADAGPQLDLGLTHTSLTLLWSGTWGMAFAYLAFLGTVDTPWSRPLSSRRVRGAFAVAVLGGWILRLVAPSLTIRHAEAGVLRNGLGNPWYWTGIGAVFLFGLVVAVSYWRNTETGTLRHRQAMAYAFAFGARDLSIVADTALVTAGAADSVVLFGDPLAFWFPPLGDILFSVLAAYGILATQLFDIDLKIKWGLEKSTVAAIFVAVFFAASEGAQVLFADFAGNELIGVAAAALLVFFLAPLQRFADKVSDQAMPGVEDTEAYREQRKREVYRASLEELMADEEITAKERRMLGRLQDELGLEGGEASRIEADIVENRGGDAV